MREKILKEDGVALMEISLVLPIMILILAFTFDIGLAAHAKINVQHYASELHKVTVLADQGGASGGLNGPGSAEYLRERLTHDNTSLNKDNLEVKIKKSNPEKRHFTYNHLMIDPVSRQHFYVAANNWNEIVYLTTEVKYKHEFKMALTKKLLGDDIELSDSYTTLLHLKSDGE